MNSMCSASAVMWVNFTLSPFTMKKQDYLLDEK